MITEVLLAIFTLLGVGYFALRIRKFMILCKNIPTVGRFPFTGQFILKHQLPVVLPAIGKVFNRFDTYFTWFGSVPTVVLSNPEYAKKILAESSNKIENITQLYRYIQWLPLKKEIPMFTESIQKIKNSDFMGMVDKISKDVLEKLELFVGQFENDLSPVFEEIEEIAYRTGMPLLYENFPQMRTGGPKPISRALNIVLFCLAKNTKYQDMLYDALTTSEMTLEEVKDLPILNMIIYESMRICPLIPILGRLLEEDLSLQKGLTIPTGTQCLISVYHMHRDEKVWGPNADEFNPFNFLPEKIAERNTNSYIPFSTGLRRCLGSSYGLNATKAILANLILKYEFKTSAKLNEETISNEFEDLKFEILERKVKG